jgi:large subunit ribosomal protein L19e
MKLNKKKEMASRTLGIGKKRIVFVKDRLEEIKEAITKQDIRDLKNEGAIMIKEIKGRKKVIKKKKKRTPGNIRIKVKKRKQEYVIITRKLRKYIKELKKSGKIKKEEEIDLRKKIRNRKFNSLSGLKAYLKAKENIIQGGKNENNKKTKKRM